MSEIIDTFVAPYCPDNIELLHQDKALLLISKPANLLSLSGKNPLNFDSVHCRLVKEFPTATLVHRLDFGTSGIMIIALDRSTNAQIARQFQERLVEKTYRAILQGHVIDNQGVIDLPIAKDNSIFPRLKICQTTGKPAVTHYRVEKRMDSPELSKVQFSPITGRTHQLRIHAQAIGHPIIGCDLYGDDDSQRLSDRLMLHAQSLKFVHPLTGETVHAQSPCPF